jgi:hypothetical protein
VSADCPLPLPEPWLSPDWPPLLLPLLPLLPPLLPPLLLVPPLPPPLLPPHAAASRTAPTRTIVKPLTTLPAAFWTLLMKRLLLLANAN